MDREDKFVNWKAQCQHLATQVSRLQNSVMYWRSTAFACSEQTAKAIRRGTEMREDRNTAARHAVRLEERVIELEERLLSRAAGGVT